MDDNWIDHDTAFHIHLRHLSDNEAGFTIEQSIAALEGTTTLTELWVNFNIYEPTPTNIRRVIEPLCRCISTLRLHHAQHPLRKLILEGMHVDDSEIMKGLFAQFLVAAKQFGFFQLDLAGSDYLPIQYLGEFCRDNNSLKALELTDVSFSGGGTTLPLPLNHGSPDNYVILTLDKLILNGISFKNSTAATVFANLVTHMKVSSLFLGYIAADEDEGEEEDDFDAQITERILSELKMPSAEHLAFTEDCRMEHFKAALDAGRTTVTDLNVDIWSSQDYIAARLELLASFIRRAVKLNTLKITFLNSSRPQIISLPPQLFQAMESCATATQFQMIGCNYRREIVPDVCPDEVQQLQKITSRNRELDRFATNPGTYPTEALPELMRQFDNCSTGRYMLARRLPEVLSFAELYAMHLSRRLTNLPPAESSKLL